MLGKVMKYELRSCGRLLLPFFGAALLLSGLARLAHWVGPLIWEPLGQVLSSLATSLGIFALFAVILLTFVYVVVRFYQGMVSGEAYLTFTLPVSVTTHLVARLLAGTLYCVASCLVALLCGLIFIPGLIPELGALAGVQVPVTVNGTTVNVPLSSVSGGFIWSLVGVLAVCVLVTVVTNLLFAYVSFAAGGLITKNRILGAVVAYLVISNVEGIVSLILTLPFMLNIGRTSAEMNAYVGNLITGDALTTMGNVMGFVWMLVGIIAVVNLLFGALHFFVTRAIYTKRLNLE